MHRRWLEAVLVWGRRHKKQLAFGLGGFLILVILVQLVYPSTRLLPFTSVGNLAVGGWQKKDAAWELDKRYAATRIGVYFGGAGTPYRSFSPSDINLGIQNAPRVEAQQYSWYLRLVPSSILWAHLIIKPSAEPHYAYDTEAIKTYVDRELGESCRVVPKNASFKVGGSKLELVPSQKGGTCENATVMANLASVKVSIANENGVAIPVKEIAPAIGDDVASALINQLNTKLSPSVPITAGSSAHTLPAAEIFGWIDAVEADGTLTFVFNTDRASVYLNQHVAPGVAIKPGVSKVTTHDFVETARQDGAPGRALDIGATLKQLKDYAQSKRDMIAAATRPVAPTVEYTRTYSSTDTGLSALLKHYAESHPGTYGISLIELSGKRRRAVYQDDKSFTTASTYKLFVAYSTLKRVEEGVWQWSDQIQGGRNLEKCFDDMIVRSDNACAEALLQKVGFNAATSEMQALGLKNTTFLKGDTPLSTAGDLSLFNATLQSGQMLTQQASRDRLLEAMKRNIYRQGIPAGTSATVADKVGFLDGLFHDAAIIYGPSGPCVLTIMSDGSNWAALANLTRQIEALRN